MPRGQFNRTPEHVANMRAAWTPEMRAAQSARIKKAHARGRRVGRFAALRAVVTGRLR
jgi:hypothetical protein